MESGLSLCLATYTTVFCESLATRLSGSFNIYVKMVCASVIHTYTVIQHGCYMLWLCLWHMASLLFCSIDGIWISFMFSNIYYHICESLVTRLSGSFNIDVKMVCASVIHTHTVIQHGCYMLWSCLCVQGIIVIKFHGPLALEYI